MRSLSRSLPRYCSARRRQSLDGLFGIRLHWNNYLHKHSTAIISIAALATGVGAIGAFGGMSALSATGSAIASGAGTVASGAGKMLTSLAPAGSQLMIAKMKADIENKNASAQGIRGPFPGGMGGGGNAGIGGGISIPGLSGLSAARILKNPLVLAGGAALLLYLFWPKSTPQTTSQAPRGDT